MLWESSIGGVIFWVPLRIVTNTTLCLVVVVCCTDDAGMILRSHWALEFAFPSVLLSLLPLIIFLSFVFVVFQLYEDLYDDNTAPKE